MGLDVTCGNCDVFSGGYVKFDNFRKAVAESAMVKWPNHALTIKDGYIYFPTTDKEYKSLFPGLYEFFTHSDCDGKISPKICGFLASEMEKLLSNLDSKGFGDMARIWMNGCKVAQAKKKSLVFG